MTAVLPWSQMIDDLFSTGFPLRVSSIPAVKYSYTLNMQMAPCMLLLDNGARSAALACTTTDNNTATHPPPHPISQPLSSESHL